MQARQPQHTQSRAALATAMALVATPFLISAALRVAESIPAWAAFVTIGVVGGAVASSNRWSRATSVVLLAVTAIVAGVLIHSLDV